jgi:hypothetical protein
VLEKITVGYLYRLNSADRVMLYRIDDGGGHSVCVQVNDCYEWASIDADPLPVPAVLSPFEAKYRADHSWVSPDRLFVVLLGNSGLLPTHYLPNEI